MMKKLAGWLAGAAVLAMAAPSWATHYILCTGLNQYKSSYVGSSSWLSGCVPDAKNVYTNAILRGDWNDGGNTNLFLNSQGTFSAVSNTLMSYASAATSGDVVLYYHSSHGYQNSGKNTGICMYDKDMDDSNFAKILSNFKSGVKVVIVLDTCHSAGMFKSLRRDGTERTLGVRAMDFAARVNEELAAIRADEAARGIRAAKLGVADCGWVTAADYNQYSWDGDEGGAFTECYIGSCKSGTCDRSPYGNGDGYATMYEMFSYAVEQEETHGDGNPSSEDYTMPQCTNTTVLSAVTYGWVGRTEPAPATAPVFTSPTTASVAVRGTLSYTATASGGSVTFALKSATAPSGSYRFSSPTLTYTPADNSEAGTQTFTFTAANSVGTVTQAVTVTVSGAGPAAPDGLRASATNSTGFTAAWNAASDATSYRLDVLTTSGSGGTPTEVIDESFQSWTSHTQYGAYTQSGDGGTWSMDTAIVAPGAAASGAGSSGRVQLKSGLGVLTLPAVDAPSSVTVVASASSSGGELLLEKSLDGGSTWQTVTSWSDMGTTAVAYTANMSETGNGVLLRFSSATRALYLYDVSVIAGGGTSFTGYVSGYSNKTVSGTSQAVTGLAPGTTYGFRVRSVNSYGTSADSATKTVTTVAADTAPVWSTIPAQSVDAGDFLEFDPAAYVAGSPAPAVTLSSSTAAAADYTFSDGELLFQPSTGGTFTFTFLASNSMGSATATLTVTVTASAPAFTSGTSVSGTAGTMVEFTATATGIPAPTVALTASTAPASEYESEGGYVVFQPSSEGTYTFTFTATSSAGSATQTVTVTVGAAPVTVPTLTLSGATASGFAASWTACDGVSRYLLQVATDDTFSAGGSGETSVVFSNAATSATAPSGWTYSVNSLSSSYLILGTASEYVQAPAFDASGFVALTLSLQMRKYGGPTGGATNVTVSASTDGGSTWTTVGVAGASSTTMTTKTFDLSSLCGASSVILKFTDPSAASSKGVGIKTIVLQGTEAAGSGSLVFDDYVAATSYGLTGLANDTLYYARVKGASDWSDVKSIRTAGATPTPQTPYEEWLAGQGLDVEDYPSSGTAADGQMSNWESYIADLDPSVESNVFEVVPVMATSQADPSKVELSFPASPDRYYEVIEYSDLMEDPTTIYIGRGTAGMTITNSAPGTRFYQIRVRLTAPE